MRTHSTTSGVVTGVTNLDTWRETAQRKPKLSAAITEDREEKLSASTATRRDTWPEIAGDPRRIKDVVYPPDTEKILKMVQAMLMKCNSKPVFFFL